MCVCVCKYMSMARIPSTYNTFNPSIRKCMIGIKHYLISIIKPFVRLAHMCVLASMAKAYMVTGRHGHKLVRLAYICVLASKFLL